ncbi:MAG: transcriptional regulator GcvA [Alphaproteobacteria bacterium]
MARHRLPPLNALRAFEATARHLSVSRAAQELHVTPAAVSHQIRALEQQLGVTLFRRLNRSMALTEEGSIIAPGLRDGFDRLAAAVRRLDERRPGGALVVSVAPSFAAKWLVPRLDRFTRMHPEIDVRISATMELADLRRDAVDAAIRFGWGDYPGLEVHRLTTETATPMCGPALVAGPRPLATPDDLRHHVLIHDDSMAFDPTAPDWRMWLKAAGVQGVDVDRGQHFTFADHAIQAAVNGVGVLLGRPSLTGDELAAGTLVMPFALCLPMRPAYYLVLPRADRRPARVVAFRDWVLREAGAAA